MDTPFERLAQSDRIAHLQSVARRALRYWDLADSSTVTLLNISENATYRIDAPEHVEPLILRVHRTGYHTLDAVRTELAWMQALQRDAGVRTPQAIPARDGHMIKTVETPALDEVRMVVMFAFIEGQEPDETALLEPFSRLGAVAARMHRHARTWERPAYFERLIWDYEGTLGQRANWGRWQDGLGHDDESRRILGRVDGTLKRRLDSFGKSTERFGLIHADLRLANLLEVPGDTRVIDFDDAGLGWFLYDLATAVSFMEARPDLQDLINAWVNGYQTVAPLSDVEIAEIPSFIMLRRLAIIAWIGSHSDTELARELGVPFTRASLPLARRYLEQINDGD